MKPSVKIFIVTCALGLAIGNLDRTQVQPGYTFQYYVRDERTGDLKTQKESRLGDYLSSSYSEGELNSDLRVVTYNADHKNAFNAKLEIQPGESLVNSNFRDKDKHLEEILKVIPKYQVRTGLPQLDIKVISSKQPLTTTETYAGQKEGGEKEREVGGDSITLISTPGDSNTSTGLTLLHGEGRPSNLLGHENQTVGNKQYKTITADTDDLEEEGRAHIKPHEDKVQLEMEQVIRAEMQEPTGVSLGVPYQQYESGGQTDNKKYLIKPLNMDYKPLVNEENIMLMGENWSKPAQPTQSASPPLVDGVNVYMLPQNIEEQEKLWARLPTSSRYPDMSRALFAHPLPSQRRARPLQALLASDRYILLPRP